MPTYVLFDERSGAILHVHRELYMDSGQSVPIEESDLRRQMKDVLPKGATYGVLAVEEDVRPVRGYQHRVDPGSRRLMLVERPAARRRSRDGRV